MGKQSRRNRDRQKPVNRIHVCHVGDCLKRTDKLELDRIAKYTKVKQD